MGSAERQTGVPHFDSKFQIFEQQAGAEMTTMYRWFENVGYGADLAQLKRDFPAPTDFESYLREHDWVKQAA